MLVHNTFESKATYLMGLKAKLINIDIEALLGDKHIYIPSLMDDQYGIEEVLVENIQFENNGLIDYKIVISDSDTNNCKIIFNKAKAELGIKHGFTPFEFPEFTICKTLKFPNNTDLKVLEKSFIYILQKSLLERLFEVVESKEEMEHKMFYVREDTVILRKDCYLDVIKIKVF